MELLREGGGEQWFHNGRLLLILLLLLLLLILLLIDRGRRDLLMRVKLRRRFRLEHIAARQ